MTPMTRTPCAVAGVTRLDPGRNSRPINPEVPGSRTRGVHRKYPGSRHLRDVRPYRIELAHALTENVGRPIEWG